MKDRNEKLQSGVYVVSTPIGNLGDITYRAVQVLQEVEFILAEDTRTSAKLLKKYGIETQMVSYRDQNHDQMIEKILEKLSMSMRLAIISDAGTPLISDPGYRLINYLREAGIKVFSVPGPSSVVAALSVAGLPTDQFIFVGFLPKSDVKIKKLLTQPLELEATVVYFDSPNRIIKNLETLKSSGLVDATRRIAVAKDLTKLYEDCYYGSIDAVLEKMKTISQIKGEYVVSISKTGFVDSV